ncbi:MAG: MarR family transcriptional regulator [Candidatus Latescibacteria bacterium]|nr:MarR family transcriptional regulator [Candidatus Latescibacterota bacterium]
MSGPIEALSDTCRGMLVHLKENGGATIAELAARIGISDEGARQHLLRMERKGWIRRRETRPTGGRAGRPAAVYEVSPSGEAFFPKRYDELSIALADILVETQGNAALEAALERITDSWVDAWAPRLAGKSLDERLASLKDYYLPGDPFLTIERNGHVSLVEHNCPFLNVAMARPALCSITVNALTRLLGRRVYRHRKFQNGDGCCEFRVTQQAVETKQHTFALEDSDEAGES